MLVGAAESGSMRVPTSGGVENEAGASHLANAAAGAVVDVLAAEDPHAARTPTSTISATAVVTGPDLR
jgi:hypothetical protein